MDNQQETKVAYIAGLMEGEGHFGIHRLNLKSGVQYRANITFTNTDRILIEEFVRFCKHHLIKHHIRTDVRKNGHRVCWTVSITSINSRLQLIALLKPYLRGLKRRQAEILENFVANRSIKNSNHISERDENGRFVTGGRAKFDHLDEALFKQYRETRDPQRLHANLLEIG